MKGLLYDITVQLISIQYICPKRTKDIIMSELSASAFYKELLIEIKETIRHAQVRAVISVNQELLLLYWEIGKMILDRQKVASWGDNVIGQLSQDLKKSFPSMTGFSTRNLKYMRRFAREYPDFQIGQVPLAQITWYHNITLLQKCPDEKERFWYAHKALEHGWSRDVMVHQIDLNLYERRGKAITNFSTTLPAPQSDMAQQTLKDPYILDFLDLKEDVVERELEDAIVKHIISFLLELGVGFAFVGRQYRVYADDEDFPIDLLFYHLKLRCYVAIDLKMRDFQPEYAGKMNFYLSALDDTVKSKHDNPSIGMILCRGKKKVKVEYALKDINKPIGISEYRLTDAIPKDLKSELPTIADLERELKDIKKLDKK